MIMIKPEAQKLIDENKCPCCGRIFTERKTVSRNHRKKSCFFIPSWSFSPQKWGHPIQGRWHLIDRENLRMPIF
jgi:hypothetical protein